VTSYSKYSNLWRRLAKPENNEKQWLVPASNLAWRLINESSHAIVFI
jgi:hypothetical protein